MVQRPAIKEEEKPAFHNDYASSPGNKPHSVSSSKFKRPISHHSANSRGRSSQARDRQSSQASNSPNRALSLKQHAKQQVTVPQQVNNFFNVRTDHALQQKQREFHDALHFGAAGQERRKVSLQQQIISAKLLCSGASAVKS